MHNILAIPALNDNYIWAILHPRNRSVVVIDPGEAQPVIQLLDEQKLKLSGILVTHHHWDHTHGINAIIEHHPAPVYAPKADHVTPCDHPLKGGDEITIPEAELAFTVIDIPGHTVGHIAYHGHSWVFTGDTLFAGGCGRLF